MKESKLNTWLLVGLIVFILWSKFGGAIEWPTLVKPPPVVAPVVKVEAATYIHEKDSTPVPSAVRAALNTLNKQGILATEFEDDSKDGTDDVPEQYKLPLAAAQAAGLPALVVTGGGKVIRVVKSPKTAAEVLEAVK